MIIRHEDYYELLPNFFNNFLGISDKKLKVYLSFISLNMIDNNMKTFISNFSIFIKTKGFLLALYFKKQQTASFDRSRSIRVRSLEIKR